MQHIIFARDRRRQKMRTKIALFATILAISCLIVFLLLDRKATPTDNSIPLTITQSNLQILPENSPLVLSQNSSEQQSTLPSLDNSGIFSHDNQLHYIQIEQGDLDDPVLPSNKIDEVATSYEDDFVAQDDLDDEAILRLQAEGQNKLPDEAEQVVSAFLELFDQAMRIQNQFSYTVVSGDTLHDVLAHSGTNSATAKFLEKNFPQLAKLVAGQQFYWVLSQDGELEYMNWLVSEKEEKIFERKSATQFSVQTIKKKGEWKQDVIRGTIQTNFKASLKAQGLSDRQINQLAGALQWQISLNKLKKGDKFVILMKREYINGKVTELGNVDAIHLITGNKSYYAIQANNGRYYNRHGETLGKGFARYPLQTKPRISSPFNPRRLHPVTRRVAPHKGVDFRLPVGTPIIAPADGVVEHVAYQANGAGRYIKIRHGGQYTTVYMHLSRQLVKVGQHVKKGERIALSGNTGRSTGPHLHYEFHINGNPVNPMTVKLPGTGSAMPEKERKAFLAKARTIETKLKF